MNGGERYYRSYFPLRRQVAAGQVVGEASPNYFTDTRCAARIAELLPEVKLIVMLRNPTDRFLSGYAYKQQKGVATTRDGVVVADMVRDPAVMKTAVSEQAYVKKLKAYDSFYKAGRLLVIKSEDYFADPTPVVNQVCDYIGVKQLTAWPKIVSRNASTPVRDMPDTVREDLRALFMPYNQELYAYLGRDMQW